VAGALAALALAGCGGSGAAPGTSSTSTADPPAPRPAKPAQAVTPRPPTPLSRLQTSLAHWMQKAGPNSGALVYDLSTRRSLFALRAQVPRPPASVEKLYTSVALLDRLGPDTRFPTTVLGKGFLGPRGVWHGDLYLRGGGDPTFGDGLFNRIWELGYGPTAVELVGQLRAHGIRRVTGRVIPDATLFDARPGPPSSGYASDIPDLGGQLSALSYDHGGSAGTPNPAVFAAKEVVLTMRALHLRARAAKVSAPTPADARPLASVSSPPLSVLLRLTDVPSDDLFAEILTKQLGVRFGGAGTTAAGARVIAQAVATYGVHPAVIDGSGLSRANQTSPAEVVALLRTIWHTDVGRILTASLPVVGVSGTVSAVARHTAAQGRCFAKTGTLNNVSNLAGYCATQGGESLAFAFFLDGPSNRQALPWLGHLVAAVARY
jgi:D-alanyl-D-alanine carboxypeptidase/D-alanyl-D-alanine-endopeptidase (penicillin-binding protein 4)